MGRVNGASLPDITQTFTEAAAQWKQRASAPENRYRMAERNRFTGSESYATGESADNHYASEADYFLMVERARKLDRDDVIAGAIVNRFVGNILQKGFVNDPKTGNKQVDDHLKLVWNDFCSDPSECDQQGENTFNRMAEIVLREAVVPGDTLVIPTDEGKIQIIENHRLKTPTGLPQSVREMTVHGVQLDGARRRVAYFIAEDDIALDSFPSTDRTRRVEAYNSKGFRQVLHVYHPKRISQTRGVSKFAPVSTSCTMHDDIQFAKLVQQQGVSVWLMMRERDLSFQMPDGVTEEYSYDPDPYTSGQAKPLKNLAAGMVYTGYPGEKINSFSPNVPNPTFFDHAKQMQQLVSINLDVPLVLLLLDASETNFSGWRGALEQAKIPYRMFQAWLAGQFHQPLYQWKLRQMTDPRSPFADPLLISALDAGINVFANEWIFPTWASTEPLKDATAQLLRGRNGMASWRRIQSENGIDWDSESSDIVSDNALLIRKAKAEAAAINQEFPEDEYPVTWMQCANLPTPDGVTMNWTQQDLGGSDGVDQVSVGDQNNADE